jgi:hypothetical protein
MPQALKSSRNYLKLLVTTKDSRRSLLLALDSSTATNLTLVVSTSHDGVLAGKSRDREESGFV